MKKIITCAWVCSSWLVLVFANLASVAWAVPVQLEFARSEIGPYHNLAIDQSTGIYYQRSGFQGERSINIYDSHADFVANSASGSLTLAQNGPFGFYSAVEDGFLLGRATTNTTEFARWDIATGIRDASVSVPGFNPRNLSGTFSYAGYSALNPMSNANGTYITSADSANGLWRVETMGSDLAHTLVGHASVSNPGFGFMIGNYIFFGDDFHSNSISRRYDVINDVTSTVDFDLVLPASVGSNRFWTHVVYDSTTDYLVAYDAAERSYFRLADAASAFGVTASVTEPGTVAILGFGLVALGLRRSRLSRATRRTA